MFLYTIATFFTELFYVDNDDKYMHRNVRELLVFFVCY